jgi:hypothetical protein
MQLQFLQDLLAELLLLALALLQCWLQELPLLLMCAAARGRRALPCFPLASSSAEALQAPAWRLWPAAVAAALAQQQRLLLARLQQRPGQQATLELRVN